MPRAFIFSSTVSLEVTRVAAVIGAVESGAPFNGLIVVEGIDALWEEAFCASWSISQDFFRRHKENPTGDDLWQDIFQHESYDEQNVATYYPEIHIPGVAGSHLNHTQSAQIRSSHTDLSSNLILVDAPLNLGVKCTRQTSNRARTSLRVPFSEHRGGLMVPALYSSSDYSLFENFVGLCQHKWHLDVFFANSGGSSKYLGEIPSVFVYVLVVTLWRTNLQFLDNKIKHVSFHELRKPNMDVNSRLHDYREDLFYLHDEVENAKDSWPEAADRTFAEFTDAARWSHLKRATPKPSFDRLLKDAESLSQFLMDSFQLLISSVSTLDAQTSLDQAQRGVRLTQLAFIYVPLSFVTGIFGMNLKELNGSPLRVWISIVTLAIVVACTLVIFLALKLFGDQRAKRDKSTNIA